MNPNVGQIHSVMQQIVQGIQTLANIKPSFPKSADRLTEAQKNLLSINEQLFAVVNEDIKSDIGF
jgi:hypothetical protein